MKNAEYAGGEREARPSPESVRGCSRAEFLQRVRSAIAGPGPIGGDSDTVGSTDLPPHPTRDLGLVRLVDQGADRVRLFTERATAGGLRVHRAAADALLDAVSAVLDSSGSRRVMIAVPGVLGYSLRERLRTRGIVMIDPGQRGTLDAQYDADAGITDCDAALAESGTIIVRSDAQRSRGTFIVPPVHVVILRVGQILPDMLDYWPMLTGSSEMVAAPDGPLSGTSGERRRVPTSVVMISGPSKTADIEGILITGVHGPREVHVVLVDDR